MKYLGLSPQAVSDLHRRHGLNLLPEEKPYSVLALLLSELKSPLIYLLFGVVFFSLIFGEHLDAVLILLIITLNVTMGFVQEYSAQKTLFALKKVVRPSALVIRAGLRQTIQASDLVLGDVVLLSSGDNVPADGVLLESLDLLVAEAILTGESEPVKKTLRENQNTLFMGTTVLSGRGVLQVTQIGLQTKIGQIGRSLFKMTETATPLQKKLAQFSRTLVSLVIIIAFSIFFIGLGLGRHPWDMLRYSLVLAIAAIPEGLPIAVTVILSVGVGRILKKEGLVKKLLSIETIGVTSVICTDKTGTLTKGVMQVVKTSFKNHQQAVRALIFLNTQRSGLEIAIWNYLKKELSWDPQAVLDKAEIIHEEAFESEKRFAKTIIRRKGQDTAYLIGAPEVILNYCTIGSKEKERLIYEFESWAKSGLRVVGFCQKTPATAATLSGFSWLGLIGVKDPVRKTVTASIAKAQSAGIDVKIVTGDYLYTALQVASEVGLKISSAETLEGPELEKIGLSELRSRIKTIKLFARITPLQKLKIIEALQANGEVVAMTGDGVNDAPALKKADIGIAVGTATDVAKAASDLVLLDSDFQTIVSAIEEGRIIFANIRKVVAYVLSNSLVEIVLIVGALILGIPLPLTIVQILWLHLICDGPPDIVLGFEPKETGIMAEKPRKLILRNILEPSMIFLILAISLTTGLIALFAFNHDFTGQNLAMTQTVVFAVIGSIDLTYIFAYKDLRQALYRLNLLDNPYLLGAVVYGFSLLLLGIYHPGINRLLGTTPLDLSHWLYPIIASLTTLFLVEAVKLFARNYPNPQTAPDRSQS